MALETTAEAPVPVRTLARLLGDWIGRLGRVWVEGQVTELRIRPGFGTVYLTLRDPVADVSVPLAVPRDLVGGLTEGARVVAWVKPTYRYDRGAISLTAFDLRPVGVGELLARLERLKAVLAAEGLFAPARKRPLPFLPQVIGVICGRASAAEHDVVQNATRRWPDVRFRVEEVAVQGAYAVVEVTAALQRLDADVAVDVIVLTRGGGSVEDLLPFSDEALCRAVATCRTPVVSAIGHEQDTPLVDLVADRRASTPTDAAKIVVPDVVEERTRVDALRSRARRCLHGRLDAETARLSALRSRPVLTAPQQALDARRHDVTGWRERGRRCTLAALDFARGDVASTRARVTALSPAATLARGYAVVQRADGRVVRAPGEVAIGNLLRLRLAGGELAASVTEPQ